MKPFLDLTCEQVFPQVSRAAISFLFRTAIVPITATRFPGCPLRGEHTSAFSATKKIGEWEIVLLLPSALMLPARKNFLNGFKLTRRKNWRKASGKIFVVMLGKTEVRTIR
ncbi:hypothetical protein A2118_03420 [Candidatus Kaiserbacteria bacterium GWA2_50_9]|uniref:Uncharacterized protein n=1 Tax=Candidatus Kaiserbacteria bacterium GWA2_50_9 TaxID=1798474 RepID=A0A1F6BVY5_9BACT|nr:MAG: hypothetical protein A2118_03420 [Candidatus Kaiserbacteria bacterium GWA2_50_9]